jgi:hypothetical protein
VSESVVDLSRIPAYWTVVLAVRDPATGTRLSEAELIAGYGGLPEAPLDV